VDLIILTKFCEVYLTFQSRFFTSIKADIFQTV